MFLKDVTFPVWQGLILPKFSVLSLSLCSLHKPSISSWERPKAFAESRPRDRNPRCIWGPGLAPWSPTPSPRQFRSFLALFLPIGFGGGGGWDGRSGPPSQPGPDTSRTPRTSSPKSLERLGARAQKGARRCRLFPPFLGRGPHGVREQEESIRIMKPQPATHCGGTEESGPVPSPPDGSEERSRRGPVATAGCSGLQRRKRGAGAQKPDAVSRKPLTTAPWQPGRPREILKLQNIFSSPLTPGANSWSPGERGRCQKGGWVGGSHLGLAGPTDTLTCLFVKCISSLQSYVPKCGLDNGEKER